jgi:signal transduction histidine kinase
MKDQRSKIDPRQVIYELKEDPLHKFNIAFVLMSIIPLLVFFYLIITKFFTFEVLIGNTGLILLLTIFISFLGFLVTYNIILRIVKKLLFYATKTKENDQLKSHLVATVSHEFNNPLAIIKLALSNLMDGIVGEINEAQKAAIKRCQDTIDRLIRLVTQILDLSKIEAGKFIMKRELVNLNSLIDTELLNFSSSLKGKDLLLKKHIPDYSIDIWADRDRIIQVFHNLVNNAIKYTPENGKISVRLVSADDNIHIEIEDTGTGIPEDKLDKVFDKFERIAQGKELGTGLGLPIAKDIVERHYGKIWVESKLGKGSKFTVLLPKDLQNKTR